MRGVVSRNRRGDHWLAVVFVLVAGAQRPNVAAAEPQLPQVVTVHQTYDGKPFSYRIESVADKAGYRLYRLSFPSPVVTSLVQNNTVPAEYYLPPGVRAGDAKRPAVICMHILDGNMELVRMTCTVLAKHGVPAILFKLPYYGERGPAEGPRILASDPKLFVDALDQGMLDMRRTVDLLASRPEIDANRIGITGISLGGIVAAVAAEREPRLARVMLVLAGGDLLSIIHHARETDDLSRLIQGLPPAERTRVEAAIRSVDPLQEAAALRQRARQGRVLMVNAAQDEVIPRPSTEKLAAALGLSDRVEWLEGLGHYTAMASLPQMLQRMVDFFGQDLPPELRITPATPTRRSPTEILLGLARQATDFLVSEPVVGKAHLADLSLTLALSDGKAEEKTYEGRLLLLRGAQGRFKLQARLPQIGEVAFGQGEFPWMLSVKKVLFQGTKNLSRNCRCGPVRPENRSNSKGSGIGSKNAPTKLGDPFAFIDPQHRLNLRMLSGAIGGAALAPDILDPWVKIADLPTTGSGRVIQLALKGKNQGTIRLALDADAAPHQIDFDLPGARGTLVFRAWHTNTPTPHAAFNPPAGAKVVEVDAIEVQKVFSAMFNFAMEIAE